MDPNTKLKSETDRRQILRAIALATSAAAIGGASTPAQADAFPDRRRARYDPNSPEVQTFYRVNRYPPK
jgi:hypothetical protein